MRRRQVLVSLAALAFASSLRGSGSSGTRAIGAIANRLPDAIVHPEDFGARADGSSDDAAALQAALNTGKRVWLNPGSEYAFGSRLHIPSGSGFLGKGLLIMLTGPGKFDNADYNDDYSNYFGLWLDTVSNIKIEARIQMQANQEIRTCSAVWVQNCSQIDMDLEISHFKEARFGLIEWNTNHGGTIKLKAYDCHVNSNKLPHVQITALSVDNNRRGGVNSVGLQFDVRAEDLFLGPDAIAAYGYQTDGVNLQGSGHAGHRGRVITENVYEPLDCFSDGNVIEVVARDCYWGVKLIHGASNNLIRATVHRFMKYALVYGGSSSPVVTKPVANNRCYVTATGGGQIGSLGNVAAVGTDGPTASHKPEFNYTEVTAYGDGINMDYIVHEEAGSNNIFVVDGAGFAIAAWKIQPTAGSGRRASIVRNKPPTMKP